MIEYLDMLAPDIGFNIKGNSSLKTRTGGCLSVCFFGILAWLFYVIIEEYFDTKNPKSRIQQIETDDFPKIDTYHNGLLPIILGYYLDNKLLSPEDLSAYATFRLVMIESSFDSRDMQGEYEVSIQQFSFVPCRSLPKHLQEQYLSRLGNNLIGEHSQKYGLCADISKSLGAAVVEGNPIGKSFKKASIEVLPCLESPTCQSSEEISKVLINFISIETIIDLTNYKQPISFKSNNDNYLYLMPGVSQVLQRKLMKTEIANDKGFLFGEDTVSSFLHSSSDSYMLQQRDPSSLQCSLHQVDKYQCSGYIYMEVMSGGKTRIITRDYKGVVETLGDLGGVKELLLIVFVSVYGIYNQTVIKRVMVEEVYQIKRRTDRTQETASRPPTFREVASIAPGQKILLRASPSACDEAYSKIESSMCIISILKQLNELKLLTSILMQAAHKRAVPFIALREMPAEEGAFKKEQEVYKMNQVDSFLLNGSLDRTNNPNSSTPDNPHELAKANEDSKQEDRRWDHEPHNLRQPLTTATTIAEAIYAMIDHHCEEKMKGADADYSKDPL